MIPFKKYQLLLFSLCCTLGIVACINTKSVQQEISENPYLIRGNEIFQDETFSRIKNNTERLCAMLSGEFIQYNFNNRSGEYHPWLVNEDKDSVIMYTMLVGEPNKIGYWLYYYQYMTSLPSKPLFEVFVNMIEINRDSIQAIYYEAPAEFNPSVDEFLKHPKSTFSSIDFNNLEQSPDDETVTYIRKNPLFFIGKSNLISNIQIPGEYRIDYYEVKPSIYNYQIWSYIEADTSKRPFITRYLFKKTAMIQN